MEPVPPYRIWKLAGTGAPAEFTLLNAPLAVNGLATVGSIFMVTRPLPLIDIAVPLVMLTPLLEPSPSKTFMVMGFELFTIKELPPERLMLLVFTVREPVVAFVVSAPPPDTLMLSML